VSLLEVLAVLAAGLAAGGVNAIVGSGSLITFPVLLAVGYPSVTANVSNTLGLALGNVSAVWGYREELEGQWRRAAGLGVATSLGAITGGTLLLTLPSDVFDNAVPVLILLAAALMALRPKPKQTTEQLSGGRLVALVVIAYLVGIYGGYFGAAQGVILLACMRLLLPDRLQRLNGLKNVLAGIANCVAAVMFVIFAHIAWLPAALIAVSSIIGAQLGATYGRKLPDRVLRPVVVVVGVAVAIILFVT
jgi:uncharacterized protein